MSPNFIFQEYLADSIFKDCFLMSSFILKLLTLCAYGCCTSCLCLVFPPLWLCFPTLMCFTCCVQLALTQDTLGTGQESKLEIQSLTFFNMNKLCPTGSTLLCISKTSVSEVKSSKLFLCSAATAVQLHLFGFLAQRGTKGWFLTAFLFLISNPHPAAVCNGQHVKSIPSLLIYLLDISM